MEAHHALSEKKRQNIAPVSGKEYGGCGTFRRNSGSALIRPEYCAVRSDTFSLHQFEETGLDTDQAADDVLLILQYPLQHGSCFLITIAAVPGQIAAEIGKSIFETTTVPPALVLSRRDGCYMPVVQTYMHYLLFSNQQSYSPNATQ